MAAALRTGQQVCVQLLAPNLWDPLLLDGQVAWQRAVRGGAETRVGIRFDHRSGAALLVLVDLIASNEYSAE